MRLITEKCLHHVTRRPFLALFRHLTALLVHGRTIFAPAALDYSKALRALLSFPPHLANLGPGLWRRLHGICWAAVLGDPVPLEAEDGDEENEHEDEDELMEEDETGHGSGRGAAGTVTQVMTELLSLIPILLGSSIAPILAPFPTKSTPVPPPPSLGYTTLLKACRFLSQYPSETSAHLAVLKSITIVFGELELNSREEVIQAGYKLLQPLVALWGTKNKPLREQLLIALRLILPFLAQTPEDAKASDSFLRSIDQLFGHLERETDNRWGITPIDSQVVSFLGVAATQPSSPTAFRIPGMQVGCGGPGRTFISVTLI